MDPVSQFFTQYKIPVGAWGKTFFSWLTINYEWFFDSIARGLTFVLEGLTSILHRDPLPATARDVSATASRRIARSYPIRMRPAGVRSDAGLITRASARALAAASIRAVHPSKSCALTLAPRSRSS